MHVLIGAYLCYMYTAGQRRQRIFSPQGAGVSHPMWVPGIEPRFSVKAINALSH